MTRNLQRRSFPRGFSVTSATASTSTTRRTARHKRRCPTRRPTPPTTAPKGKSGPTATSARSSVTGATPVTMTRPFEGHTSPACTIGTFAHRRRPEGPCWGVAFCLRVIVWCLYCPHQSFQAQECFFVFFLNLRISSKR